MSDTQLQSQQPTKIASKRVPPAVVWLLVVALAAAVFGGVVMWLGGISAVGEILGLGGTAQPAKAPAAAPVSAPATAAVEASTAPSAAATASTLPTEAQERMSLAVAPDRIAALLELAVKRAIESERFIRPGTQVRPSLLDPYKALIAEVALEVRDILFVQAAPDPGGEAGHFLFELWGGGGDEAYAVYHFAMVHAFDEDSGHRTQLKQ